MLGPPCGLTLASRVFFDLESDLEEPLITFEIFWMVLSPMDSVRLNFGDLAADSMDSMELDEELLDLSSLKELLFFNEDATSLLNAPNS